jgi:hypothetical protein
MESALTLPGTCQYIKAGVGVRGISDYLFWNRTMVYTNLSTIQALAQSLIKKLYGERERERERERDVW